MGQIVDIGRRIELVPMDSYFHDIAIALYQQQQDIGPSFLVHTYSRIEEASQRIKFVIETMQTLGGMTATESGLLQFPCGLDHQLACKRIFLEACKFDSTHLVESRPDTIFDKKSSRNVTVLSHGNGRYQVTADGDGTGKERRVSAIAGGLIKLGDMMAFDEKNPDQIAFPCGCSHDALVGLLLVRAPNVRAVVREQQMTASRGVLSSPSQQK
jgi:hypothetical protein